jgi:hypothetical protein
VDIDKEINDLVEKAKKEGVSIEVIVDALDSAKETLEEELADKEED